jgi:alpha-N-arabinofuranosidase
MTNSFFGAFNPYAELITGDWFIPKDRKHHPGAVYLNGTWLSEAAELADVYKRSESLWFAEVSPDVTVIRAQFGKADPNRETTEINVRRTVFYPDKPGRNYITVRGFAMRHAATPWAPPTAEQVGLIGTHWSKGWIIESNTISHSICSGVTLGKYGDEYDNKAESASGYVGTINRALSNGWNKATVGGHIVLGNTISHCEQAGIVGSMGCAFSTVTGNVIHDIHVRRLFGGAEMAGIKFHGAVDVEISRNHIYRTILGVWLDWMAQGARVSWNLFHDNEGEFFMEVDHGPLLVDNNLFLSGTKMENRSEGSAFVHNLFTGVFIAWLDPKRSTPYHKAHSTEIAGLAKVTVGDDRFFNNWFVGGKKPPPSQEELGKTMQQNQRMAGFGTFMYDFWPTPPVAAGNLYFRGARPASNEVAAVVVKPDPGLQVEKRGDEVYLHLNLKPMMVKSAAQPVTSGRLGVARIPNVPFEAPDGTPVDCSRDYFGQQRDSAHPMTGPLEQVRAGRNEVRVW